CCRPGYCYQQEEGTTNDAKFSESCMTDTPFFSIILPTYNRGPLLSKSISSVLSQKFTDFELIVVDDGSTDNTREVVQSFSDPRIHYYYKENEERNFARNFGISMAKGKYVCFLRSEEH